MIACIESFGSGPLLELASLHGIDDADTADKDELRTIITRHIVLGE